MFITTAQEIKNIDRRTIESFGIPGVVLMENAAAAIMTEMHRFFDGLEHVRIGIICGRGNNGGDGLALARRLRIQGVPVRVALLAPFRSFSGDAAINLAILRRMDVELFPSASPAAIADLIGWADILVDALLGVGLNAPLGGNYAETVGMINSAGKPVVAVDIPTGIHANTGAVMGSAIQADLTVTMLLPKRGLMLHPGSLHAGEVRVADIGAPMEAIERERIRLKLIDRATTGGLPARGRDAHKGNFGHAMILGGSPGKAGAALMAAQGALRVGAGLVSIATPAGLVPIMQSALQEAMCIPIAENAEGTIGADAATTIRAHASSMAAIAIGPGLSTHPDAAQAVYGLVRDLRTPLVIDADGLNALSTNIDLLKRSKARIILTPHPGEMARLLGCSTAEVQHDRIGIATSFAVAHRVIVVLKGAGTVVALPDGSAYLNTTGNPGMATGGTGDILTGLIVGLLAQGHTAEQAACIGVHVHGLAGDAAAQRQGESAMIARDLIAELPVILRTYE